MTTAIQTEKTNGLETSSQQQIIGALKQNPQMAAVTFSASNTWLGATRSRSNISRFSLGGQECRHQADFRLDTDLPVQFLGTDQGPTPAEYALQALAACMNTTMIYNCAARGIEVRSSTAFVEGDMDCRGFVRIQDAARAGYGAVRVRFEVDADAPAEIIAELAKGSPMFDVFSQPVPVEVEVSAAATD